MTQESQLRGAWLLSDYEYFNIDRVNQSSLKKILIHPVEYIKDRERITTLDDMYSKPWLILGSLVDTMLCDPDSVSIHFKINKYNSISGQILTFINYLIEHSKTYSDIEKHYQKAFEATMSKQRKKEWFIEKLTEYEEYLIDRIDNKHLVYVEPDTYKTAERIANSIGSLGVVNELCFKKSKAEEAYHQLVVLFEHNGVELKAKFDSLKINHKTKEIIISDFKTTSKMVHNFKESFYDYNYGFQAAFYLLALQKLIALNPLLKNYTVRPFYFIVETTNPQYIGYPIVFEVSENIISQKLQEVEVALEKLIFHQNNGFKRTKDELENNCIILID